MKVQQPVPVVEEEEGEEASRPGRAPRWWQQWGGRKIVLVLLLCLALVLLLIFPAATRLISPGASPRVVQFKPVGDVTVVTAPGFDSCVAPPVDLLQTWWEQSPYRWLNLYLGGASMFPDCGGKNLTPEWVKTVYDQGWSMLPTWVGPQAPCARQHTVMSSDTASSYAQGLIEADAAIQAADQLGFSSSAPIYFDLEYFKLTRDDGSLNEGCIRAVNSFLRGWNSGLMTRNHLAGVYASASDYPVLGSTTASTPIIAWIAGGGSWTEKYNHTCTVYGNKFISDDSWNSQQRIYQYTGGHDETYGHKSWNIDSDCADAPMVGHVTATSLLLQAQQP